MYFMGEKKLGRAPEDLAVYQLAWALHKTPDEIREMDLADRIWMIMVPEAQRLANDELAKRTTESKP